ncbi:MAG TPA: choice-of-anchor P family protein [Acidimicrobiales bacterium]|nr:choice-of-anchor P family protein [Acidimicrobiales bacterium]
MTIVAVAAAAGLVVGGPARAADQPIMAAGGPLTRIDISDQLNCQADHTGDTSHEWYGGEPGACATLVVVDDVLYGPAEIPAGGNANRTPFTAVSQSGVTGAGTAASPYKVVTVVDAGTTGVRLTETDSYVPGDESYRTDVVVTNGGAARSVRLYRAGDCFLQNSDRGYGRIDQGGAISCTASQAAGTRIEQMLPLTAGSHFYENSYNAVWAAAGSRAAFPDTCICDTYVDNGLGLSWDLNLGAGASTTVSSLVTFSPLGIQPLRTAKTADAASAQSGGTDGYTITVSNPNAQAVTLSAITDTLPAGFTYAAGTTSGTTTADPTVAGQDLSWAGPFTVPATGNVSLHFGVHVATAGGDYYNQAGATATGGATVVPTGPTAPVHVGATTGGNGAPRASAGGPYAGNEGSTVSLTGTATDPDGDALTTSWTVSPQGPVAAGTSCTLASPSSPSTTVTCNDNGQFTVTFSAADATHPPVTSSATLTVGNVGPAVAITRPAANGVAGVGDPLALSASFTDAGRNDTHTCSVQWGDGSTSAGTVSEANGAGTCAATHTYAAERAATITVTVTDDDGGTGSASVGIQVRDNTLSGSAFGLQTRTTSLLSIGGLVNFGPAPSVQLPPTGGGPFTASLVTATAGSVTAKGLAVSTQGYRSAPNAYSQSTADVAQVRMGMSGALLALDTVHGECRTTGAGSTGLATIGRLAIAGNDVQVNAAPGPNSSITVPGVATIYLNEQVKTSKAPTPTSFGATAITLNAVRIVPLPGSPLGSGEIIVGQVHCDMEGPSVR